MNKRSYKEDCTKNHFIKHYNYFTSDDYVSEREIVGPPEFFDYVKDRREIARGFPAYVKISSYPIHIFDVTQIARTHERIHERKSTRASLEPWKSLKFFAIDSIAAIGRTKGPDIEGSRY